jgi:GxxExxY protein
MKETYMIRRNNLLHPELSFKINGLLFDVHNELGGGHPEKHYQKAVAMAFKKSGLSFREQVYTPLTFKDQHVGKYFLDFLIEDKIVLELKRGKYINRVVIIQAKKYLTSLNLCLAVVACFAQDCVVTKRIVNHELIGK